MMSPEDMNENKNNSIQSTDKSTATNSLPKRRGDNFTTTENDNLDLDIQKEKNITSHGEKNINNNTKSTDKSPASKNFQKMKMD